MPDPVAAADDDIVGHAYRWVLSSVTPPPEPCWEDVHRRAAAWGLDPPPRDPPPSRPRLPRHGGPDDDWCGRLAALHGALRDPRARRRLGAYCTPAWLAHGVAETALAGVEDPTTRVVVLDVHAGCGQLLWAAAVVLARRAGTTAADVLARGGVRGRDADPVAVRLARLALVANARDATPAADGADDDDRARLVAAAVRRHVRCCCAAADDDPADDADAAGRRPVVVVLGNPPWRRRRDRLPAELAARYPRSAALPRTLLNDYHLFLEDLPRLRPARFAVVLPDSAVRAAFLVDPTLLSLRIDTVWQFVRGAVWPTVRSSGACVVFGGVVDDDDGGGAAAAPVPVRVHAGLASSRTTPGPLPAPPPPGAAVAADPADVAVQGTLCPRADLAAAMRACPTSYRAACQALGIRVGRGPRAPSVASGRALRGVSPPSSAAADGDRGGLHPLVVHRGSAFHLPYLFDDWPCLPKPSPPHRVAADWAPAAAAAAGRHADGDDGDVPVPVVVVQPLYVDRGRGRASCRACLLPPGRLVDSTVLLHRAPSEPLAAFLLGFWNARVTRRLLCDGLMAPSGAWITRAAVDRVPFPLEAVRAWRDGGGGGPVARVAEAARRLAALRRATAARLQAWFEATPPPRRRRARRVCWALLTTARGGRCGCAPLRRACRAAFAAFAALTDQVEADLAALFQLEEEGGGGGVGGAAGRPRPPARGRGRRRSDRSPPRRRRPRRAATGRRRGG